MVSWHLTITASLVAGRLQRAVRDWPSASEWQTATAAFFRQQQMKGLMVAAA